MSTGPEMNQELVKKRARVITATWLTAGLFIIVVLILLAGLAINAYQGSQTRGLLVDCVTPTGQCFKDGQVRQADAISQLIEANELTELQTRRIILASIACDKIEGVDTLIEAEECVKEQLAQEKAAREADK